MAGMRLGVWWLTKSSMAVWISTVGIGALVPTAGAEAGEPLVLREEMRGGCSTRVQIELKAQGLFQPGLPPGGTSAELRMPKPLELEIQTRLVFSERIVEAGENGRTPVASIGRLKPDLKQLPVAGGSLKVVRHVIQAASAINGEVRPTAAVDAARGRAAGRGTAGSRRAGRRGQPGRAR